MISVGACKYTLNKGLGSDLAALGHGGHVGQDGLENIVHALGAAGVLVKDAEDAGVGLTLHLLGVGNGGNPEQAILIKSCICPSLDKLLAGVERGDIVGDGLGDGRLQDIAGTDLI